MPPKRTPNSEAAIHNSFKKQKIDAARRIDVEIPPGLPSDSMEGLPATVDIERFAQARTYELGAMQSAMKSASATASHRVWQTLPRHLRRRAASHDVRRVPVRLREKAKLEIDPTKRKTYMKLLKRKKHLARHSSRTENLLNRQKNKTWLETHIWHAKRMHMQNIWGYRLAIRPTEKSYRPSHRAAVHGSTLHDVSYTNTLELTGQMRVLTAVLKRCSDPCGAGPWAIRYSSGARVCHTHIYSAGSWPQGLIAPATIIWRPTLATSEASTVSQVTPADSETRTLWIRVHPAVLKSVMEALQSAHEQTSSADQLEVVDLSGDINAFELVGPRTSQVIHGAFHLANNGRGVSKFWQVLANARSPGNFSPGMVIGLSVHDPRLHYPPTNAKIAYSEGIDHASIVPDSSVAQSELWEQSIRDKLRTPKFKKAALDIRRSQNLVPGVRLRPTKEDDRLPIMLIQNTISAGLIQSGVCHDASQKMHGWTILLPPSWSMSFLNSLVYTGTRVVGLTAQHHQKLEVNCPHFPDDYVGVPAYTESATQKASEMQAKWERTPKGKRINYESIGISNPWTSDWGILAGNSPGAASEDLIPTGRPSGEPRPKMPWLFPSPEAVQLVKSVAGEPNSASVQTFGEWLNSRRSRRGMVQIDNDLIQSLFDRALVHVRIDMLGRGNPKDRAILYGFASNEAASQWLAIFESQNSNIEKNELASNQPDGLSIIGYITSGSFSLQVGHGHGIGAVRLRYIAELAKSSKETKTLVRVRDLDSRIAHPAFATVV